MIFPKPDKFLVTFWGTRGSIPTPGRLTEKYGGNTACVTVRYGGEQVIIDAGSGVRNLGLSLTSAIASAEKPVQLHLFLSHTHWDHIQGLPFFAPAYMPGVKLTVYGSPDKEHILEDILAGQMDWSYFPVDISTFAADLNVQGLPPETFSIGSMQVDWQEQTFHPGGCIRFRISVGDRKLVYASDIELESMFSPKTDSPELAKHRDDYLEFIKDADLLIADAQYTSEEYTSKVGWGHTSIPLAIEIARKAGVKQLAMFHHDPLHTDRQLEELEVTHGEQAHAADGDMSVFWAREAMTLAL